MVFPKHRLSGQNKKIYDIYANSEITFILHPELAKRQLVPLSFCSFRKIESR